jgi:hypothetical protein
VLFRVLPLLLLLLWLLLLLLMLELLDGCVFGGTEVYDAAYEGENGQQRGEYLIETCPWPAR